MKKKEIVEKWEALKKALNEGEVLAAELVKHSHHGASPFVPGLRGRVRGALESIEHHEKWLMGNPPPEDKAAAPAPTAQ